MTTNPLTDEEYSKNYYDLKEFWQTLPSQQTEFVNHFLKTFDKKQLVILSAKTGAGKSTQIPKLIINYYVNKGNKSPKIVCTQPMKTASRKLAERVSEELDVKLGNEVGYQFRGERHLNSKTVLSFVTDGLLLRKAFDMKLDEYDCIIIDEAHKRSVNIDLLLFYLKKTLKKNKDIKIVIMSATIEAVIFKKYFSDIDNEIVNVEGRIFPVKHYYLEEKSKNNYIEDLEQSVLKVMENKGSILVFLPSKNSIKLLYSNLSRNPNFNKLLNSLHMFWSGVKKSEEDVITKPSKKRKIILSTNVAETSLTIPDLKHVIDSGLEIKKVYDPLLHGYRINTLYIAQASILQRCGRAGRTSDGNCFHVYTKDTFNKQHQYNNPSIENENISSVILDLLTTFETTTRVREILKQLIQPPNKLFVDIGIKRLEMIDAVKDTKLTDIGFKLSKLPVDPTIGICLLVSEHHGVLDELLRLTAILETSVNVKDFLIMEKNNVGGKIKTSYPKIWFKLRDETSEHISLLKLHDNYKKYDKQINYKKMAEVDRLYNILKNNIKDVLPFTPQKGGGDYDKEKILKCLTYGYFDQIVNYKNGFVEHLGKKIKIYGMNLKGEGKILFSELVAIGNNYNLNVISILP